MKKVIFSILFIAGFASASAQNFREWTQQKKTQLKYLGDQIVAFKVFAEKLEEGYGIAKQGLGKVAQIRSGEKDLHELFFESLVAVNPRLGVHQTIEEMIQMHQTIRRISEAVQNHTVQGSSLTASYRPYIKTICQSIVASSFCTLQELEKATKAGYLEISDAARIRRIEELRQDMGGDLAFIRSFAGNAFRLERALRHERQEIEKAKHLNGFK